MTIQELKEQKETIVLQLNSMRDELGEGNVFTDEQLTEWDALDSELKELDTKIATQERLLATPIYEPASKPSPAIKPTSFSRKPVDSREVFRGWALSMLNRREHVTPNMIEMASRSGVAFDQPWQAPIRWDQTVGTDAAGGFAVNEAVVAGVIRKLKSFGGMIGTCNVFSTASGESIKKIVHDSTAFKATKTAEAGTIANSTQSIAKVTFGSTEYTSGIYEISMQLLRDSSYDILGEFQSAIADSFGRAFNDVLTKGTGTGEPQGIEAAVSAITPTTITHDNLLALYHSVDSAYRNSPRCAWMVNDATLLKLKQTLKDADGRPLYNSTVNNNVIVPMAMELEGKPVVVNTDLSDDVILFGDFDRYHVRLVGNMTIRVLQELFALSMGVGIVAHSAVDGRLVDNSAIKKLVAA